MIKSGIYAKQNKCTAKQLAEEILCNHIGAAIGYLGEHGYVADGLTAREIKELIVKFKKPQLDMLITKGG